MPHRVAAHGTPRGLGAHECAGDNNREVLDAASPTKHHQPMFARCYQLKRDAAREIYTERPLIYSPFFKECIFLGSEGFKHLRVSATGERSWNEQVQRFRVLPLGLQILKTTTTLRGYRRRRVPVPGSKKTKLLQWWTFAEFFRKKGVGVRVVVRKVGNGRLHFWSVMLDTNGMGQVPNLTNAAAGRA